MNRLNDTEYKNLFAELISADALNIEKLNVLSNERVARAYEALSGKRSQRSVSNTRFIKLVADLSKKHSCKLVGRNQKDGSIRYERHEAGYSVWSAK